jgi:hypothetical protein
MCKSEPLRKSAWWLQRPNGVYRLMLSDRQSTQFLSFGSYDHMATYCQSQNYALFPFTVPTEFHGGSHETR